MPRWTCCRPSVRGRRVIGGLVCNSVFGGKTHAAEARNTVFALHPPAESARSFRHFAPTEERRRPSLSGGAESTTAAALAREVTTGSVCRSALTPVGGGGRQMLVSVDTACRGDRHRHAQPDQPAPPIGGSDQGTTAGQSGPHPRPHAKRTGVATVTGLGFPTVPSARWRCLNWRGSCCTAARLVRSHVTAATTSHDSLKVGSRSTHGHTLG